LAEPPFGVAELPSNLQFFASRAHPLRSQTITSALLILAAAVLVWAGVAFNRLVRLKNQVAAGWADIDVQLSRRHDLVPRLVAAVKAYVAHEHATLEAVTALRARAVSLQSPARLGEVEKQLEAGVARLLALREAYPELKASENFSQLQRDLVDVEDHLQYARRFYNGAVRDYNTALQRVPDVLVARAFGFREGEFYQAGPDERSAPRVELR
jgi:LemA protein